jgi:hypothetical protein
MIGTVYVLFLLSMMSLLPVVRTFVINYKNFVDGFITGMRIIARQFVAMVIKRHSGIWPGIFVIHIWCLIYFLLFVIFKLTVFGTVWWNLIFYFMGTVFDSMSGLKEEGEFAREMDFASKPIMKRPTKITQPWKFESDDESSCSTPPSSPRESCSSGSSSSPKSIHSSPKSPGNSQDLTEKEDLLNRLADGSGVPE